MGRFDLRVPSGLALLSKQRSSKAGGRSTSNAVLARCALALPPRAGLTGFRGEPAKRELLGLLPKRAERAVGLDAGPFIEGLAAGR
mmetsp:Transcript_136692/g.249162  ORF Transcript_136692/g.249162 Transcript_136692/m.249162 type:complete len:86 (+) Transcript_136692:1380-1637(+)